MFAAVDPQWTLDHALPIVPQVHRTLRERIIRGDLPPGHAMSETDVARRYATSRQPVREAFIKLAQEGLLSIRPQRGTVVNKIDYAAVLDARFLREAVEADIVRILAHRGDPALVSELRRQVERQKAIPADEPVNFSALDETFHRTLAEAAGRGGTWSVIQGQKSQMDRVRFIALRKFPVGRLLAQHGKIIDTIEAADPIGADTAIRVHLREVLRDLPHIQRAQPDLFDLPDGPLPEPANTPLQTGGHP